MWGIQMYLTITIEREEGIRFTICVSFVGGGFPFSLRRIGRTAPVFMAVIARREYQGRFRNPSSPRLAQFQLQ